jgi:drug/metabolite transporter (DMT)-like permease
MSLQALLAALFWGASFPAAKMALAEAGPLTLLVVRYTLGAGFLMWAALAQGGRAKIRRGDFWAFFWLSFFLTVTHQGVQVFGLTLTTATNSGWLIGTAPIFIALIAWLFLGERLRPRQWLGMAVGLFGTFVVITQGDLRGAALFSAAGLGDFLVLVSAVGWGGYSVVGKGLLARYPAIVVSAYGMGIGMVMAIPVWLFAGGPADLPHLTVKGWGAILYLAIFSTSVAYVFWYRAMRHLAAGVVGAYMFLQPLEATLLSRLILKETVPPATIAGGLLILSGVYLVTWPSRPVAVRAPAAAKEAT